MFRCLVRVSGWFMDLRLGWFARARFRVSLGFPGWFRIDWLDWLRLVCSGCAGSRLVYRAVWLIGLGSVYGWERGWLWIGLRFRRGRLGLVSGRFGLASGLAGLV